MYKGYKPFSVLISLILFLACTTGCWDRLEIEDVGIVIGAGVDIGEADSDDMYHPLKKHPLMITHQLISSIPSSEPREGKSEQQSYFNLTSQGFSFYKLARDEQTLWSDRPPYGQLIKVVVIGKEAAKAYNLQKLLNALQRDQSVLESVVVLIAEDTAKKIFDVKPQHEQTTTFYLKQLTENQRKSPMIPPLTKLYHVAKNKENNQSFLIQQAKVVENGLIRLAGAGVIHGKTGKMISQLDDADTMGINFLIGKAQTGVLEVVEPKNNDLFAFEFYHSTSTIRPQIKNNQLHFSIHIDTEGRVGEDWLNEYEDLFQEKNFKVLEKAANHEIKRLTQHAVKKMQEELKTDLIQLGKEFQITYPDQWKKIKGNWDEEFTKAKIEISVNTHIREFGTKGKK